MPAAELGTKQVCPTCQSKFYDLNRRPAHCPKCGSDFDPEEAIRTRRVRSRVGGTEVEDEEREDQVKGDDAESEEEDEETTPEIDEAADEPVVLEDEEGDGAPAPAEDLGVAIGDEDDVEEDSEDVPFLEDEEDDFAEDDIEGLPEEGETDDR